MSGRPSSANDHYIEFQEVTKAFGERVVLDRVSFYVRRGETLVIMGRSGVGKSVSLKHILGFLKPDSGQVFVGGRDITHASEDELAEMRRRVTMVFQSGALFDSLSVAENVAFPLETREDLTEEQKGQRVRELLEMLEVGEAAEQLPSELSTGMKRSVAIARALAQDPEAILYDEPTTMVDPIMAGQVGDLIRKLKEKFHKTSVVVTHDTHLARKLADRVMFLHDGHVAFFGPWSEFEGTTDGMLRAFLSLDELIPAMESSA